MFVTQLTPKTKSLICVFLSVAIDFASLMMTLPIKPFLILDRFGGTVQDVGLTMTTINVCQIVSAMWMGRASDTCLGRRNTILVSILGSAVFTLIVPWCRNLTEYYLRNICLGLFSGSMPVGQSYIAAVVSKEERPKLLGMLGGLMGLAILCSPPLGSTLAHFGLDVPFYVGSSLSFASFVYAYYNLADPSTLQAAQTQSNKSRARWAMLSAKYVPSHGSKAGRAADDTRWASIGLIGVGSVAMACVQTNIFTLMPLFMNERFGWGPDSVGLVLGLAGLGAVLTQLFGFQPLVRRSGVLGVGFIGFVSGILGMLTIGFLSVDASRDSLRYTLSGTLVFSCGFMLINACTAPALADCSTAKNLGQVVSIGAMTQAFGRCIGPTIWSALYDAFGPLAPFQAGGTVLLLASPVWLVARAIDRAIDERRSRQGLPSRRRFLGVIADAIAQKRDERRAVVLEAAKAELEVLLVRGGYDITSSGERQRSVIPGCTRGPFHPANHGGAHPQAPSRR